VFSLWLTLLGRSAGHAILHVNLAVDRGTVNQREADIAVAEAAAVWAPYGVEVKADACTPCEPWTILNVVFTGRHHADTQEGSIGSIEFASNTPRPNVSLYVADVRDLIDETLGEGTRAWPTAQRDVVEGRALGRALAHEVGHYLLRTRDHTRSGLMRANQPIPMLIDRDRRRFSLSRPEVARLDVLHAGSVDRSILLTGRVTPDRNSSRSNLLPRLRKGSGTMSYE
jgi:hypothetical protein